MVRGVRSAVRVLPLVVGVVAGAILPAGVRASGDGRPGPVLGPAPLSTREVLRDMTDLATLGELPVPPYTCRQFSSYDRRSTAPTQTQPAEEGWFANGDAGQFQRVEEQGGRREWVLMDAAGPGAIVRIWSANPKGTLRVYLDEAATPALEAPMTDLLSGKHPGLPEPLAHVRSAGWNLYFPILYAKHCKVTSDADGFYYHVNYRTYETGTPVETFTPEVLTTLKDEIAAVAARLAAAEELPAAPPAPEGGAIEIAPGATKTLLELEGPRIVTALTLWVAAADRPAALRAALLTMEFDGEPTVAVPLGDFFGAGPELRPSAGLPLDVLPEGVLRSRWVMPFERAARVAVRNTGSAPLTLRVAAEHQPYEWSDRALHFGAGWRVQRDVPTRPMQDWNYVTLTGEGVFVGAAQSIVNPVKHWWGEGDEKIYVDGEPFPSHFGTGTEDYFGYAWCSPQLFRHAYHGQSQCDGPFNYGRTAVHRWHILDRIPFRQSLRFDMELWHAAETRIVELSVVTYWYARPGAKTTLAPPGPAELKIAPLPPYKAPRVAGALEGEELRTLRSTGTAGPQDVAPCSNERHLWWRGAQPGEELVLAFPAPAAGRYTLRARCVQAGDYGIVQIAVNGRPAGGPRDFYHDGVAVTDEFELGTFELRAGENELSVTITGANPAAVQGYMFGLDYLKLEPAE